MKKTKYINRLFLFALFSTVITICSKAAEPKSLTITKITSAASPSGEAVPALLDQHKVESHPIEIANWQAYPYKPEVSFRIAHTGKEILLHYKVKEASVRAVATKDNGRVWEDACVEFFVSPDGDNTYYNFECSCIGKLLIQEGIPGNRKSAEQDVLSSVKRWSSLGNEPFDEKVGECSWELTMIIPVTAFYKHSLESLDGKKMKGNFYKCGDKLQTPHFLSWSPIQAERPMFHLPAYFGTLFFE
jgi:hypothetical protein